MTAAHRSCTTPGILVFEVEVYVSGPLLLLDCYVPPLTAAPQFARFLEGRDVSHICAPLGVPPNVADDWQGVIITGSAASVVDREPWMADTIRFIQQLLAADIPVLGCCFGHQLLACAAADDWDVVYKREAPELGYIPISLASGDTLFDTVGPAFRTFVSHEDEVRPHPSFEVLGTSPTCPVHALRVHGKRAWSMQFHVEYTPEEELRILTYRAIKHAELGLSADGMFSERVDSDPLGASLFNRFIELSAL